MPRKPIQSALPPEAPAAGRADAFAALAGGLAHELNNLLSVVAMSVNLLEGSCASERDRQILGSVGESARRGVGLVRQLLWLARGVEEEATLFQPRHLLLDVERMVQAIFPAIFAVPGQFAPDLWLLRGDPFRFYRAILDVCLAASTHRSAHGGLALAARNTVLDEVAAVLRPGSAAGPHVVLEVSLRGGGGELSGAAASFLAVCGGVVEIAEDQVLRVYMPASGAPLTAEAPSSRPALDGAGELILIVERDSAVRQAMAGVLERHSYRALAAADGAEAVALFAQSSATVAAVIAGAGLSFLDAPGVLRAVRRLRADVPTVAAGTEAELAAWPQGDGGSAQAVLAKPFTAPDLLEALRRAFSP